MELCDRTASDLAKMLRKREVSSREVTESVLKRMDEREDNRPSHETSRNDPEKKNHGQRDQD